MLKADISGEYNAKGEFQENIMQKVDISGEYNVKGGYFMRI